MPQPLLNGAIPNSFSFDFSVGVTTVELVVADQCGNEESQFYTITVLDCDAPIATNCPPTVININVSDDGTGDCFTDVTWTNPDFDDNCLLGEMTISFIDPGTNTPSYVLPSGFTGAGPHVTYAGTAGFLIDETYNFFHGTTTVEITYTDEGPGGMLTGGVAVPSAPLSTTCYIDVVVTDDEVPTLDTPVTTPINLSTSGNADCPSAAMVVGIAVGPVAFGAPFSVAGITGYAAPAITDFSDNCPDETLEVVSITTSGDNCTEIISIVWLYEDCGGNPIMQTQVFNIDDDTGPSLTGTLPASTGINACFADAVTASAFSTATVLAQYTDDGSCQTLTLTNLTSVASGDDCAWSVVHTFDIEDGCGNNLSGETYTDMGGNTTLPSGTAPAGLTALNVCMDLMEIDGLAPVADDITALESNYTPACTGGVTATLLSEAFDPSDSNCSWTLTRTYSVVDDCGLAVAGNVSIVHSGGDTMKPTGNAPAGNAGVNACLPTQADADAMFVAYLPTILAAHTDNCGPTPLTAANIINVVSTVVPGSTDCGWTVAHTYEVIDDCGNIRLNRNYSDTGSNQTGPTFTNFEPDQNLDAPSLECGIDVFIQKPFGTDLCTGTTLRAEGIDAFVNGVAINFGDLGSQWNGQFPVGSTSVTITLTDLCGNTSTDEVVIVVNDVTAPEFTTGCPSDIIVSGAAPCNSEATFSIPTVFDACVVTGVDVSYSGNAILPPPSTNLAQGTSVTETFGFGTTTVTLTALDANNLSSSCSFVVTSNCSTNQNNCVDTTYVSSVDILTFGPDALFRANLNTHSDGLVPNGFDIEFFAGDDIDLKPGFEVELGAVFLADIVPCFLLNVTGTTNELDDQKSNEHQPVLKILNEENVIETYEIKPNQQKR